jgi:hypothetical protein
VNSLEYWEHAPDGTVTHFAWVTDIPVEPNNLMTLMRGARARWKIENETFNTLKNQGYHFEHNFGHGHRHLSTVLMHLMMLAFLIDQIQQRGCRLFQAAVTAAKSKTRFWRQLRTRFDLCLIPDWDLRLIEQTMPDCASLARKAWLAYWLPRSEGWISPEAGWRRNQPLVSASVTRSAVMRGCSDPPTTARLNRSSAMAKYRQPSSAHR